MDWINIGQRIRRRREELHYTRETLAEKINVTPKFCSDIELGVKGMSVPTLLRIAETLQLSTDYILYGGEERDVHASILAMVRRCPHEKLPFLENTVAAFVSAVTSNTDSH